jgi:NAD(P)H-hydrate epimerase
MKLVSVDEMKQLEAAANAHGFSYEMMMLKAGNELARVVHRRYSADGNHQVVGLVGSGNNGGDTLVALSSLSTLGWSATAILFKPRSEDDKLLQTFLENGGIVLDTSSKGTERKVKSAVESAHVILDGVLGTGFKLPLSLDYARLLGEVKKSIASQVIVAVDCPSGVDCESGESSKETLDADLTICMEAVKQGLVRLPAFLKC